MLQRSVTLIRRLSWTRPKESTSGRVSIANSLDGEHSFERQAGALDEILAQFHTRLQIEQGVAKFLERVHPHIGTLTAVAVFIGYKIEVFFWGQLSKRMTHSALGHDDELARATLNTPIDDGRSGTDKIRHGQNVAGALGMGDNFGRWMILPCRHQPARRKCSVHHARALPDLHVPPARLLLHVVPKVAVRKEK